MTVKRSPKMRFKQAYERVCNELDAMVYNESKRRLFWMEPDEIKNWMLSELWIACLNFDPSKGDARLTVLKYWSVLWRNRRIKLMQEYYTAKNQMVAQAVPWDAPAAFVESNWIPMEELFAAPAHDHAPPCPVRGRTEVKVWRLLHHGYTQTEIQRELELSRKTLESIMASFRNAAVHEYLTGRYVDGAGSG